MTQVTQYQQLQPEGRKKLSRALSRSPSTTTYEMARNTLADLPYGSHSAQVPCLGRRVAARAVGKLDFVGVGWCVLRTKLDWK